MEDAIVGCSALAYRQEISAAVCGSRSSCEHRSRTHINRWLRRLAQLLLSGARQFRQRAERIYWRGKKSCGRERRRLLKVKEFGCCTAAAALTMTLSPGICVVRQKAMVFMDKLQYLSRTCAAASFTVRPAYNPAHKSWPARACGRTNPRTISNMSKENLFSN